MGSLVQFSYLVLELCSFNGENDPFYALILSAKIIHQHIGQHRSRPEILHLKFCNMRFQKLV